MPEALIDILMITHNRPEYTALGLPQLLDGCDERARVWIWHNGGDEATRAVVQSVSHHDRVFRVHYSATNEKLWTPTRWLWQESDATYVGKVDDDCLVPHGWSATFRTVHDAVPELGVVGCSRLLPEDIVDDLVQRKLKRFESGHTIMQNPWVAGSGYLMKRECILRHGLLRRGESFPAYCIRLALSGWTNGFYFPFLLEDHMDDPRSPHTLYRTDADFQLRRPLTATLHNSTSLEEWTSSVKRNARLLQEASTDPTRYGGWRHRARMAGARLSRLMRSS